jgi:formylmethanofuran dehydrogenase subunit E
MRRKDLAKADKLRTLFALNYDESEVEDQKLVERLERSRTIEKDGLSFEVCEVCGIPTDESYAEEDGTIVCTECAEL